MEMELKKILRPDVVLRNKSEEQRLLVSKSWLNDDVCQARREKISLSSKGNTNGKGNLGRKNTLEQNRKISESKKGKYCRENHPGWKGGNPKCVDCGIELAGFYSKRCHDCQVVFRRANPVQRRKLTEEEKLNISQKTKEAMANPELKERISNALKGRKAWNTGIKSGLVPWNKGVVGSFSGEKNGMYKGGPPKCPDCGRENKDYHIGRCRSCYIKQNRGEKIWNYKGGTDSALRFARGCFEYRTWRKWVFQRDWFTCQLCGYTGRNIQAHHIVSVKNDQNLMLDIDNGITLCKDCHNKTRYREYHYEVLFAQIVLNKKEKVA